MSVINEPVTIEAGLAWALIWIAVILFLGSLIWGMLNPYPSMMHNVSNATAAESQQANTGWWIVTTTWKMWPLWFSLGLLYYGFRRALNESEKQPSR